MAGTSILVINAAGAETRVALVESGNIHEFYLERKREKGIVGNIYKGRVVRVLPGMQAAFVDIGLEKAAFLYVGDVYGDPDFSEEFELTEGEHAPHPHEVPTEQEAEEQEARALESPPPAAEAAPAGDALTPSPAAEAAPVEAAPAVAPAAEAAPAEPPPAPAPTLVPAPTPVPAADTAPQPAPVQVDPFAALAAAPVPAAEPVAQAAPEPAAAAPTPAPANEPSPAAAAGGPAEAGAAEAGAAGAIAARPTEAAREAREPRERDRDRGGRRERNRGERGDRDRGDRGDRDRDRGERGDRDRGDKERGEKERGDKERGERGERDHRRNGGRRDDEGRKAREPKSIQDLLKEGQEVIVQVAKDPIGTKGARITSHISLPGRHLVFMPTVDHIGISRRIEKEGERRRLREIVDRMRPDGTGFIVRTVAENVEAQKLEADIRFLIQVWNEIIRQKDKVGAPALLHPDLDLILRATRDLFTADVNKLVIDDRDEYERILRFVHEQAPHLESSIELYQGDEPIFDAYGIEQELKRASQRKVWLKSGGYIIIDQAEALTAVDVNSGRYVGKKNLEETITKINTEAAKEIVYQLRLRNIGGIIIIDFIDMDKPGNRDKVFRALQDALGRDKAKTNVLKISELGLVEMTRKRVRESVTRVMNEPCGYCDGKGHIKSKTTVAYEILRDIRREAAHFGEPALVVNCHPEVARVLQGTERDEVRYLMDRFNKTIQVKPQQHYHQEQFDLYGRQERSEKEQRRGGGQGGRRDPGGEGEPAAGKG
ncbi:MAG: Rne/Rng family ribonuclease [Deltaproteobacteria bacterium]|nr:Rne/Rng family ribonuclease [Deltaproteobacteria bacterium]